MPLYTADALILRTYTLGESDRIVVFLTRDRGKKRGVAKNARQSRRRFGGALEPMTCGRVGLPRARAARAGRAALRRAGAVAAVGADGDALGYVGYFAELIDEWAQEADPNETLFRLGASMVDAMAAGVPDRAAGALLRVLAAAAAGRVRDGRRGCLPRRRRFLARRGRSSPLALGRRGGVGRTLASSRRAHRAADRMHSRRS